MTTDRDAAAAAYAETVTAWRVGDMPLSRLRTEIMARVGGRYSVSIAKDGRKSVGLFFDPSIPGGVVHKGEWVTVDVTGSIRAYAPGDFERRFAPLPQPPASTGEGA